MYLPRPCGIHSWNNSGHSESVAAEMAFGGEGVLVCGTSGSGWEEACHWVLFVICDGCIPIPSDTRHT